MALRTVAAKCFGLGAANAEDNARGGGSGSRGAASEGIRRR